jgi:hypothetical protein
MLYLNNKKSINSYKKLYKVAEEILDDKGQATSNEIANVIIDKYKTNNLNVNGRSITYHLKQRGYPKTRKYRCGGYIFYKKP